MQAIERMSEPDITWHIWFLIKTLVLIGVKNSFLQCFMYQVFQYLRHGILWDRYDIKCIIVCDHITSRIQLQITNF